MFRENSNLKRPGNSQQPLWRYLKYEYLLDLLSTESLYFRRVSLMSDKWEGLLTARTNDKLFKQFYAQYRDVETAKSQIEEYERHRHEFHISCWHMNNAESYLMWKVYADRGCAIETTFERMAISFDEFAGDVEGGVVDYIDYGRDEIPVGNIYHAVVRKDLPYRDEKEFRLLFWENGLTNQPIRAGSDGIKIRVSLNKLISKIWLDPQLKGPTAEIESLVEKKSLDCEICRSAVREIRRDREAGA